MLMPALAGSSARRSGGLPSGLACYCPRTLASLSVQGQTKELLRDSTAAAQVQMISDGARSAVSGRHEAGRKP